jgi:ADP-heptose:LPS heptosyltransferase/glycosyltransferase involved in cell wall biosynthesis
MPPKTYEAPHEKDAQGGFVGHLMSDRDKEINRALAAGLVRDWIKRTPAKTLDVGSKYPYLAYCLKALGCEAYGMDNIEITPEYSRELGVPMLMADFESTSEEQIWEWTRDGKFSLITLVHLFEHMYDPLGALRKLRRLVADDGVLFLRLPDHGVAGFSRDLTPSHYTIHPFFHSLPSLLELLVRGQDLFTVRQTYPLNGAGQRDLILAPLVKKPVVFAGLIVKNEERDLPRCLRSIETVVDGVVLVDTGSTDATLEVARAATKLPIYAQTYTGASRKDDTGDWKIWNFSGARNVFVREIDDCGADYVLWVDADDELLTPHQLRRVFYWDQYDVFGIQVKSSGSCWTHHRVWKTRRGIHFEGRCHEYPTYGGHAECTLTDVAVYHHAEPGAGENSNARNMRILLEEYAEAPSPRTAFYLANTYRDVRRYAEAVPWYDRRIALGRGYQDEWLFAHLYKANCQRLVKDFVGARQTLHQALAVASGWAEFWMELAYCCYDQHDYEGTIGHALIARDKPQPPTALWREPNKYTDQPPRLISWCYEHLGELAHALTWALRARDKIGGRDQEWEDRIERLRYELEEGVDYDEDAEDKDEYAGVARVGVIIPVGVTGARGASVLSADAPPRPRQKIAICRPGAIGDVIMTLNLVPLLRQQWPLHEIHYYCHPSIGAGLKDLILASGVVAIGDSSRLDAKADNYERVFNLVGYPLEEGYPERPLRRHLLDYFATELGLKLGDSPQETAQKARPPFPALRLSLPPRRLELPAAYATLQVKTGWSAYKEWPVSRWAEVVRACLEIPIYQIGTADEPLVEGARHDLMGERLAPTIEVIANATLHLGLDSYANHLTHYLWEERGAVRRVPAVILWGSTQVSALGYDHNTNISLGLSCQPCFREDPSISRMPRGPCINPPRQIYAEPRHACMGGIEVGRVVQAVRERWELALGEKGQP